MEAGASMFLEPTVYDVGIHAVAQGQGRDGCPGLQACSHHLGFEFPAVRAVRTPPLMSRNLWFSQHRVHAPLRAHDLARLGLELELTRFRGHIIVCV